MQEATTWKGNSGCSGAVQESAAVLQAVGQVKGWKVLQIVFEGGMCGSIHVESFNRNMKELGVLESKWDPIRKKLVIVHLRNRTRCYGPTSHKREGRGASGGAGAIARAGNMSKWDMHA